MLAILAEVVNSVNYAYISAKNAVRMLEGKSANEATLVNLTNSGRCYRNELRMLEGSEPTV